jgi:hypothetical protein
MEYQDSTTFPRPQPFWWHERRVKLEPLGEGKSQRALPKPPEVQSQTPPQAQFHISAGTEGIARWILTYRRHRKIHRLVETESVKKLRKYYRLLLVVSEE